MIGLPRRISGVIEVSRQMEPESWDRKVEELCSIISGSPGNIESQASCTTA
jgi:hypothetical protein